MVTGFVNSAWDKITLNLLRIITGFLFIPHGAQKIFGVLGGTAQPVFSYLWMAGILEFFGGVAILLGIFTRPVAFLLSGLMAFAYWMAHGTQAFLPILNKGELAVLYCFVFLVLAARGGGGVSLDGWIRGKK
tara:strand:- start:162 stop:557 length:396 start_codon:yes stop_codon:yes gene_type:complete